MSHDSAKRIEAYSFLVAFARNGTLSANELAFIERLALEDGDIDDEERQILHNIFARVPVEGTAPEVLEEIARFKARWQID